MNEIINQIREKLNEQERQVTGRAEDVMKPAVKEALINFCKQSTEFAETVASTERTFADCMKAVAKNHGNCISDIEAYRRAVAFYMDGAEIEFSMTVKVPGKNNITFVDFMDLM